MRALAPIEKIDYLVIGHLTKDLTQEGARLGGTATYASLTARALGLRVGIVSAFNPKELSLDALKGIPVIAVNSQTTTIFENIATSDGRKQILHQRAEHISLDGIPDIWKRASIIHLGPVVREVESQLPDTFSPTLLGLTPQGWMRDWDEQGIISPKRWSQAEASLNRASAAVLSLEDVNEDEELIEEMSLACRVLSITEADEGARLYWNHDLRRFPAPQVDCLDSTGAGDIYATAFFIRLRSTRDPWEAARFATCLASHSVQRSGVESIPTEEEIQLCQMEVL